MAKKWKELRNELSTEAKADVDARVKRALAEMPLFKLRQAMKLSQESLAEAMGVNQSSISKIEHNTDLLVSTLRKYVSAIGGSLVITARMPDGEVQIVGFEQLGREAAADNERPEKVAAV